MGLVKIRRGKTVYEVTQGAFDSIYSKQGFEVMDGKKKEKHHAKQEKPEEKATEAEEVEVENNDEIVKDEFADLISKPISNWSKDEIKDFAEAKGIDISETKNAKEAKEIIKKYLEDME